jgi:hypothetical protein
MKVGRLLKLIEDNIKCSNMLGCYQYGMALKVIEDLMRREGENGLAQKANSIQSVSIFKEGG